MATSVVFVPRWRGTLRRNRWPLAEAPGDAVLFVYHTWTLNQFSAAARERLDALLATHAAKRNVFRISIGHVDASGLDPVLALTVYANSMTTRQTLARCQSHGEWIEWLGEE